MLLFGCSEGVVSLQTISIRTKLVIAFSILTVFAIGLGVLGLVSSYKLREQSLQIENNWLPSIRMLG
jgi:methyl-accepting chemotaxis protein